VIGVVSDRVIRVVSDSVVCFGAGRVIALDDVEQHCGLGGCYLDAALLLKTCCRNLLCHTSWQLVSSKAADVAVSAWHGLTATSAALLARRLQTLQHNDCASKNG
jgi:hypothetical protein